MVITHKNARPLSWEIQGNYFVKKTKPFSLVFPFPNTCIKPLFFSKIQTGAMTKQLYQYGGLWCQTLIDIALFQTASSWICFSVTFWKLKICFYPWRHVFKENKSMLLEGMQQVNWNETDFVMIMNTSFILLTYLWHFKVPNSQFTFLLY